MAVKIYTTPTCVYCRKAKDFFKINDVKYEEVNVLTDQEALKEMVEKSHQMGVPVIDVNGEIFVGYDKDGLSRALGLGEKTV
jgi:glutaredoxin 3